MKPSARKPSASDGFVLLADQDRSLWDRDLIAEGQAIVRRCLRRNQPGPYQIQAAIYDAGIAHTENAVERAFLVRSRRALG